MLNRGFMRFWVLLLVLLGVQNTGRPATFAETGEGAAYWRTHSVIYAEVTDVEMLTSDEYFHGTHRLQVRPLATLTGSFDCARHPNLELGGWFGLGFRPRSTETVPKEGVCIVAVIQRRDEDHIITPSFLAFMPEQSGLIEVKDFADPLVAETMNNLQALRRRFPF